MVESLKDPEYQIESVFMTGQKRLNQDWPLVIGRETALRVKLIEEDYTQRSKEKLDLQWLN